MTAEADLNVSLAASLDGLAQAVNGLHNGISKANRLRQRAAEQFRQVPFIINVPLSSGAATINASDAGPNLGFYWSVRKFAAVGFSAGTVNTYIDNTGGEPLVFFAAAGVQTFGKGHLLIHPNSNIAIAAASITGTVQLWGTADQFEHWMLPWYMGAWRDEQE